MDKEDINRHLGFVQKTDGTYYKQNISEELYRRLNDT
jgi:hypothetical protein